MTSPTARHAAPPDLVFAEGEMGALMRAHDWSTSPLGTPEGWPPALRTVVGLMLGTNFPMFVAWGPELAFLYNDGYRPIFGAKHPHALGRPFREVWSEIWPDIAPLVDRALAGEATFHENLPLVMLRHGYPEEAWFTFSYSPARDDSGRIMGVFCACTETTQKVVAERRLRATEEELRHANARLAAEGEHLRELFHQAPGFMAVLRGPDHVFELANAAYQQLVGHRPLLDRTVRDALPEVAGQGFYELLDRVYATGEPFVGYAQPLTINRRPGLPAEKRFVTFVYQPIKDAAGTVTGIFVEGSDVTQATHTDAALRELNATLERRVAERTADRDRMWRLSTDIMLVARFDTIITAVNPAWTALLDWREGDLLGRSFLELLHPEDLETTRQEAEHLAAGRTTQRFENRYRHRDGSYRWISWMAVPDESFIHAVGRDVTADRERDAALRKAEEQLRQAQKLEAVGQLTGGVAHDFNNLLQALGGCLSMIARRTDEPRVKPLLDAGQQAVQRGAKLVQQLMAFARRESLRPEPINVRDRILGMSALLERALRADIAVTTGFEPELWPVEADPTQFELALINLAVNARDAMPEGGRLAVTARNVTLAPGDTLGLTGEFVELSIADTGLGMPADVMARAFDPFFTTKELGKGSGLGLAQVYGLALQAGGTARITSEEGVGTTVRLWLRRAAAEPVTPGHAGPGPDGRAAPPRPRGGGRVLFVEDDPVVASTVGAALEDAGYEVAHISTADEALPLLVAGARVDILFSDVVMPGRLSGVDLAHEAQRLRPGLPVVLTTGYSEEVARAGGVRVLGKPYHVEDLLRVLDGAMAAGPAAGAAAVAADQQTPPARRPRAGRGADKGTATGAE